MSNSLALVLETQTNPGRRPTRPSRNGARRGRAVLPGPPLGATAGAEVCPRPTPVLATKLHIPTARPEWLQRPRLVEKLDAGLGCKLTLLSAPAGSGKTSLLSEWLAHTQDRVAWLDLDRQDSDPARFWTYIVAALQTVHPDLGQSAMEQLRFPQRDEGEWMHAFMAPLLNDIARLEGRILLVLDNYHLISSQAIHDSVAYLLRYQPQPLHLVISTRADPPLPVVRLRAQGQLTELRFGDLCFNLQETAALLNGSTGLGLKTDEIEALAARTEGWIAGLHLAALSLQGHPHPSGFISAFAGSHHHVVAYLADEVLHRLPLPVQRFLLRTSILDCLCGSLCDALVDAEGMANESSPASPPEDSGTLSLHPWSPSQQMLERLHRENLFVLPLDDEGLWYRYHRLFADLLRLRAAQHFTPGEIAALHRRASEWYAANDSLDEAIRHAVQAQDFALVADLAERAIHCSVLDGWLTSVLDWLEPLPADVLSAHPRLRIYHAWALFLNGYCARAEEALAAGRAALEALPHTQAGEALREELLCLLDAMDATAASLDCALKGDLGQAIRKGRAGIDLARHAGDLFLASLAARGLALAHVEQGRLQEATHWCQQAIELARRRSDGRQDKLPLPLAAMGYVEWARVCIEQNQLDTASRLLHDAAALCQRQGGTRTLVEVHLACSQLRQARGDLKGAQDSLAQARQSMPAQASMSLTQFRLAAQAARLHLACGEPDKAAQWLANAQTAPSQPTLLRDLLRTTRARVLLAQHEPRQALAILDALHRSAKAAGRMGRAVQVCLLQALAWDALGDGQKNGSAQPEAVKALAQSLRLAAPEGYVRLYIDAGPAAARLLTAFCQDRSQPADLQRYAHALLDAFGENADERRAGSLGADEPAAAGSPGLLEPLTRREKEVLRLLATDLTSPEIAEELIVAVSTVRSHIKAIYRKLDVHNRFQAIHLAATLQLV